MYVTPLMLQISEILNILTQFTSSITTTDVLLICLLSTMQSLSTSVHLMLDYSVKDS